MKTQESLNPIAIEQTTSAGHEFVTLLYRIWIGAKTADHPAEEDYQKLYDEFISGKREVADHAADEVQLLQSWGEHDLAREMIITAVHDALHAEAQRRTIEAQAQRIAELEQMLKLYFDGLPTGPAGYTSWPVAPLHDQARNVLNR